MEDVVVGENIDIDVRLNTKVPVNALGTTITIPEEVEVVGISKEKSFLDLWTEETAIRQEGREIRFSGGTLRTGGLTGMDTALTVTVRAKKPGEAQFSFKDSDVRAHDGTGNLVTTEARTLSISIAEKHAEEAPEQHGTTSNADFDGKDGVTLVDMSILAMRLLGSYDSKYDLNHDGSLGLADLSIFFSMIEK